MFNDIRLALRQLAAAKSFTITAVVTLALGIGANTGIFTLVHALMMKSLPVADPQRIIRIGDGGNCCVLGGLQWRFSIYSYPLYHPRTTVRSAARYAARRKLGNATLIREEIYRNE